MRRPGPATVAGHVRLAIASAMVLSGALLLPARVGAQVQPVKPPAPAPAPDTPEGKAKPIESIGVPQAEPPPAQPPPPGTQPLAPANPPPPEPPRLTKDEVRDPGYLPGYRETSSLGLSPYAPAVGALPGGVTPAFQAPMPPNDWTFQFTGFMNMTAQFGINQRPNPAPGQSSTVFHVPPQVVDEYQSFVGTATMPGNWIQMNFRYGNRNVTANLTLSTWNPSIPTTYYQLGSQGFVNNAFLTYNIPNFDKLKLRGTFGYFFNNYGNLGPYTAGIYQMPYVGAARGIGGTVLGEYPLTPDVALVVEEGLMGNRNGRGPSGNAAANPNSNVDPLFGSSYIQHLHAGLIRKTEVTLRAQLHWMVNFMMDDRPQFDAMGNPMRDNMVTRGIDESHIPDGRISVYGLDASMTHPVFGLLAIGASHIDAHDSWPLRGLLTFGGEGKDLTERWLGNDTNGTGTVDVAGINWSASLGRILASPRPFDANGPDLALNAGAVVAVTHTNSLCGDAPTCFDGRIRHKYGIDALYAFSKYVSAGARVDRVVPNSKDSSESFEVLAGRLVFKTDWQSRESIMLLYAKWFYGPNTHPEYSSLTSSLPLPRLDDQLIALNVNMWW
ncbi:MAG TPA: hypothetical protein VN903_35810 [Polyangia bacterium]|jgi:hypothetical protein|nr:hypothetical protein [Polyangia bacterium]